MLQLAFRFQHGCEFNRLAQRFPALVMAEWCNYHTEILELQAGFQDIGPSLDRELASIARRGFKELRRSDDAAGTRLLLMRCAHRPGTTITDLIERYGAIYLPPLVYRDGWEHYRIMAFQEERVEPLFRRLARLGRVELTLKRRMQAPLYKEPLLLSAAEILSRLTAKQASSLLAAVEAGYYEVPRLVRTEDIAKRRRVPRTTFEEHVRKGESKILTSFAPYVALWLGAQPTAAGRGPPRAAG